MITRTTFAGFGGQGVLLMGYILSHGAMLKGLNVTYFPSYGAEMRGGTANCTVTLSDRKIASPVASNPDVLVAMNFPSLEKFESTVIQKGLIFFNASLIEENPTRTDVEVLRSPPWSWPGRRVGEGHQHGHDRALCRQDGPALPGRDRSRHAGRTQGERQDVRVEPEGHRAGLRLHQEGKVRAWSNGALEYWSNGLNPTPDHSILLILSPSPILPELLHFFLEPVRPVFF